jgi:hypothetical protein
VKQIYSILFVLNKSASYVVNLSYVYANSEDEAKQISLDTCVDGKLILDGFKVFICQANALLFDVAPFNVADTCNTLSYYNPDDKSVKVGLYVNLQGHWFPDFSHKLHEFLKTQSDVGDVLKLLNKGGSNDIT